MLIVRTWWTITTDPSDARFANAELFYEFADNGVKKERSIKVPYWFAQFAQLNTQGADAACDEYLIRQRGEIIDKPNPFDIVNATPNTK